MILALEAMSPDVQGILFLVATVLFVIAAVVARAGLGWLIPAGLAFFSFVFAWQAFSAAG